MPVVVALEEGKIALPADIRRRFGIEPGTRLELEETADGIVLRPVSEDPAQTAYGMLAHLPSLTEALLEDRRWECEREEAGLPPPRSK